MKKLIPLLILTLLSFNYAGAFFIWQDFDNPNFPPAGWTLATSHAPIYWDWSIRCSGYGLGYGACKANYSDAASGTTFDLITPLFYASGSSDSLMFDHAYATYGTNNDVLKIYYSTNGGTAWTELITLNGGASGPLVTAPPTGTPFVPLSTQWATKKYVLPTGTNKIKFTAVSAYGNNLFLDNIKIGTPVTNDVGAVGFRRYVRATTPGQIDSPKVYVRNFGSTQQSFSVTLTITPGTYTSTQNVTNLAPGASQMVNFPPWSSTTTGNYIFKAYTTLSGEQNNPNDTISNTYIISTNPRNVLVEYCTGTWCQWCPCGKSALVTLESYFPNTNVLAYHGSGSDPWINFNGNSILGLLGLNAYPLGTPERTCNPWDCGSSGFVEYPFMRYLNFPVSPVKIDITNLQFNATSGLLTVNLNTTALENLTGQFKINYVITEDNLVYNQSGNTYCTGGSTYVHKWVVRNMVNGATGENLNTGGTWTNGQTISKSFSTTINSTWVAANCKLKVFVYKDGSPLNMAEVQQSMHTSVTATGVNDPVATPVNFELSQNYPNPFNPVTNIKFAVPKDGYASLKIYDISGKLVATYLDEYITAGYYNAEITSTNLASGTYLYTLESNGYKDTKKMVLIK